MTLTNNCILDHHAILNKLKRIAYQIYECNVDEIEIILAGIEPNGFKLAEIIATIFEEISPIKVTLCNVSIDKENPLHSVITSLEKETYTNKSIVLIDDVLNSGATLMYCVKHFLNVPLKQFKTAVLINRNHKKYPVKADFKGLSLSTSLKEHVYVDLDKKQYLAYLK